MSLKLSVALGALVGVTVAATYPASAQTSSQIDSLQQQIQQLQQQLRNVQTQVEQQKAQPAPATPAGIASSGGIQIGGVNLKFGGFIEAATIFRTRNEVADVASDFNGGLPFANSPKNHENETRFSARQSRVSGLVSGDVNKDTHLAAYIESDFLAAPDPSNSRESNSFSPRLRHGYATIDKDDWGFHFLGGQSWSLLTTNSSGIIPRNEQIPLTIDAQYSVGFTWKRLPQLRFVENFGNGVWAGLSLENPQASIGGVAPAGPTINANNPGDAGGLLSSNQTFTTDVIPDVVGKIAFDPGFGHYELKGVGRFFTDNVNGKSFTHVGGGVGAAATLPVVPKFVDFQLSGLAGYGIGTYGSGQLNDVTFDSNGRLTPIPEIQGLLGLIGHPVPGNDTYLYLGYEQADRKATAGGIGYGAANLNNTGCNTLNGTCQAVTHRLAEATLGFWQDVFKGPYGRVVVGAQASYEKKYTFSATGGGATGASGPAPNVNEGIFMTSFRYYPF